MPLDDLLARKLAEVQAAEAEAQMQASAAERQKQADILAVEEGAVELRDAELFGHIQELQAEKIKLKEAFSGLKSVYEDSSSRYGEYKQAKDEIQQTYEKYKPVLAKIDPSIRSRQDVITNDRYAEDKDVQELLRAKGDWGTSLQNLSEAVDQFKTLLPDVVLPPLSREKSGDPDEEAVYGYASHVVETAKAAVDARAEEIDRQIKEFYDQTSEGLAFREEVARGQIKQSHDQRFMSWDKTTTLDMLSRKVPLVSVADIAIARQFGEGGDSVAKDLIVQYYLEKAEGDKEEERKKKGLDVLSRDVEALSKFPERLKQIQEELLPRLRLRRQELAKKVESKVADIADLQRYFGRYGGSVESLSDSYFKHLAELGTYGFDDPVENIEHQLGSALHVSRLLSEGKADSVLAEYAAGYTDGQDQSTRIPNLDYIGALVVHVSEFYDRLDAALSEEGVQIPLSNEVTASLGERDDSALKAVNPKLRINSRTAQVVKAEGWDAIKRKVEQGLEGIESKYGDIEPKLRSEVEHQWARTEVDQYQQGETYKLIRMYETAEKERPIAAERKVYALEFVQKVDEIQNSYDSVRERMRERYPDINVDSMGLETRIKGRGVEVGFGGALDMMREKGRVILGKIGDEGQLDSRGNVLKTGKGLKGAITLKQSEIKKAWFPGGKNKDLADLQKQLAEAEAEQKTIQEDIEDLRAVSDDLSEGITGIISGLDLSGQLRGKWMPPRGLAKALVHEIENKVSVTWSPEEQRILDGYERAKKNLEKLQKSKVN